MLRLMPASWQIQKSKIACVTAAMDNMVMVAGEIKTQAKQDYEEVIRG
jgi:S-adenosylmethionine synthetase